MLGFDTLTKMNSNGKLLPNMITDSVHMGFPAEFV